jgi:uncharacterized membrane protein YczE
MEYLYNDRMDKPKRRGLPFFPIAVVVAVCFLSLLFLILTRVEDSRLQGKLIRTLIGLFVGGLGVFSWISAQWGRQRASPRTRFSPETCGPTPRPTVAPSGSEWTARN